MKFIITFPLECKERLEDTLIDAKEHIDERVKRLTNSWTLRILSRKTHQKIDFKFDYVMRERDCILEMDAGHLNAFMNPETIIKDMQKSIDKEYGKGVITINLYLEKPKV